MKKKTKLFQRPMLRLIAYRVISKIGIGLSAVLLWNRFWNAGHLSVLRDGFFTVGIGLLVLGWFSWLGLDGMTWKKLFRRDTAVKRPTRKKTATIMDFAEEPVVGLDDLEEAERRMVYFVSSIVSAIVFLIPALFALLCAG